MTMVCWFVGWIYDQPTIQLTIQPTTYSRRAEMSFLNKLKSILSPLSKPSDDAVFIYVHSHRCKEYLSTRIFLNRDLSEKDDEGFIARKTLVGDGRNRCFERVEVILHFDARRNLIDREIAGGEFISAEEYEAGLAS